jgi:GNAT superfamily N-acetyltransferase
MDGNARTHDSTRDVPVGAETGHRLVEVRRVRAEEWQAVKALRLEALQDTPIAYCERYDDAVGADDATWRERAEWGAEGGTGFQVLGWEGERPVATSVGYLDQGDVVLAAVYVTPSRRGQGLLDRLVDEVVAWARGRGAPRLRLLVHESNGPAQRAYARLAFRVTGHREPYPLDPSTDEVEMARLL